MVQTDVKVPYSAGRGSTTGSKRFETFKTHQNHIKVSYSPGTQLVRKASNILKPIKFISNYLIVLVY